MQHPELTLQPFRTTLPFLQKHIASAYSSVNWRLSNQQNCTEARTQVVFLAFDRSQVKYCNWRFCRFGLQLQGFAVLPSTRMPSTPRRYKTVRKTHKSLQKFEESSSEMESLGENPASSVVHWQGHPNRFTRALYQFSRFRDQNETSSA